jgi:hypothetical protein
MNTRTKTFLGAALMAVVAAAVNTYVPESEREHALTAGATIVGALLGWLGFKKPGQA